jgi:uncharacterized phage-associated protein
MAVYASDPNASIPRLTPNRAKILESILVIIEAGERSNKPPTQFDIAKTIFLADYRHMESYGRPITYDNFVAMKHGPVPSQTYDMLKPSFAWASMEMAKAPWVTREIDATSREFIRPSRSANRSKLSESDVSALYQAFADVKAMGFAETSDVTHRLNAYMDAWSNRGSARAKPMDLRLLLPDFDEEMIDNLEFASKHQ